MVAIYCRTSVDNETSIEQQKQEGIRFCLSQKLEYRVFIDEGKSGYKIDDDDIFKNRPAFSEIIDKIKRNEITGLYIWDATRLSRNQYANAIIYNLLERYKVKLYEFNKEIDFNEPQIKLIRGILGDLAEYNRQQIVSWTTRGLYHAIDTGRRGFAKFYGYRTVGRNKDKTIKRELVEPEIENVRYAYKRLLEINNLRQITREIYHYKKISNSELKRLGTKWTRILRHFEYTGNALTREGLQIKKDYFDGKDINIAILKDSKYYNSSLAYPEEIISIDDWCICAEKLKINVITKRTKSVKAKYRANKNIATGLIKCSCCDNYYYAHSTLYTRKNKEKIGYNYYKHYALYSSNDNCKQSPKTFKISNIDSILEFIYFIYYFVFDNKKSRVETAKQDLLSKKRELKDEIKTLRVENKKMNTQIEKFNKALGDENISTKAITVLAERITVSESKLNEINQHISELESSEMSIDTEMENLELQNIYYDTKEMIRNFLKEESFEEKRNLLIGLISKITVYNRILAIEINRKLFIVDTTLEYKTDYDMLLSENFYQDEYNILEDKDIMKHFSVDNKFLTCAILDIEDGTRQLKHDKIKYDLSNITEVIYLSYE
jgi:site-specific DNA recombinase